MLKSHISGFVKKIFKSEPEHEKNEQTCDFFAKEISRLRHAVLEARRCIFGHFNGEVGNDKTSTGLKIFSGTYSSCGASGPKIVTCP